MPSRTRGTSNTTPKGRAHWEFGGDAPLSFLGGDYGVITSIDSIDDTIFEGDNEPLFIQHYQLDGGKINGRQSDTTVWTDYLADFYSEHSNFTAHLSIPGNPDNFQAATEGAARTNPSQPSVDIPAELGQAGDMVESIRDAFSTYRKLGKYVGTEFQNLLKPKKGKILHAGSSNYVNYQFNIVPTVGDLVKLLQLQKRVARRVKEIRQLHTDRGLRRTVEVFSGTETYTVGLPVQTNFGYFYSNADMRTVTKVKVHCRWLPEDLLLFPWEDHHEGVDQALRALIGGNFDFSSIWQITPWTWLIDWASSVGSYLKATRNTVGAYLHACSVMRYTRTEQNWTGATSSGSASLDACRVVYETKSRALAAVIPEATIPFLDKGGMAVLDALLASRLS